MNYSSLYSSDSWFAQDPSKSCRSNCDTKLPGSQLDPQVTDVAIAESVILDPQPDLQLVLAQKTSIVFDGLFG